MVTLECKQGDTLTITGTRTDGNGDAVSLANTDVHCDLMSGDDRVTLVCTVTDAVAGVFRCVMTDTSELAVGLYRSDVEFNGADGSRVSTDTMMVNIVEDVTVAPG